MLPEAGPVIQLFERLKQGLSLAADASRLAKIAGVVAQRTAAGLFTAYIRPKAGTRFAAVRQRGIVSEFDTNGSQAISSEHGWVRKIVNDIGADPHYRGKVYQETVASLGSIDQYNAAVIREFEREYELQMYKAFYSQQAHIVDRTIVGYGGVHHNVGVAGVPEPVQQQLMMLTGTPNPVDAVQSWKLRVEVRWIQQDLRMRTSNPLSTTP